MGLTTDQYTHSNSTALGTFVKVAGKVALSGTYCAGGLLMIATGTTSLIYTYSKTNRFLFDEPTKTESAFSSWLPFLNKESSAHHNLGFGDLFHAGCSEVSRWSQLASGPSVCDDLSNRGWKEITSPESCSAAAGVILIGGGSIIWISSALIMGGLSMLSKSWSTLTNALLNDL